MFKRTEGYARNVGAIYRQTLADIINLVKGTKLEQGKPFNFADYGYGDEVTPMLRKMYSRVYQTIRGGVEAEWLKADENNDGLVKAVFGEKAIENHFFAKYFQHNMDAMKAFATRKTSGLDLSQRVWRYTGAYKEELENTLDLALGEGTAANRLATKIQKYLDDPDRWYRRFRVRIGEDEDGNPKYGRIWKRRVYDNETQGYKWIDDNPKSYHPGTGVYRSSYRNAQRLARTETNIAYRTAEFDRWQTMPFVIGIEIKLSNNHGPEMADICDELAGIYPKGFKWTGWHPNCRCYQQPALAKDEERDQMLDRILDGGNPDTVHCEDAPTDLPPQFKGWLDASKERMERATEKGTLPYFIKDNEKIIKEAGEKGDYAKSYEVGKGRVNVHSLVNPKDVDYDSLVSIAEWFARLGHTATLVPKLSRQNKFDYDSIYGALKGTPYYGKCPDLKIDEAFYEFEGYTTANPQRAFRNMLHNGLEQSDKIIIKRPELTEAYMKRVIWQRLQDGQIINEVWIKDESGCHLLYKKSEGQ